MIEFSHVSKLFGAQKAVNDLNLNFQEGSFSVLIGTSGSGKSTTLKMINRLGVEFYSSGLIMECLHAELILILHLVLCIQLRRLLKSL